jgi:two-component system CitB family response regulator
MYDVLVVQADQFAADSVRATVSGVADFGVRATATDFAAATTMIARHEVDLLLLDLELPDGSGLDLMAGHELDMIVLSSAASPATVRGAIRRGAIGYLIKPYATRDLVALLGRYRRYRSILAAGDPLRQPELFRALRALHGNDQPALDQLRVSATARDVAMVLRQAPKPLSATEIAQRVSVAKSTAQRYLRLLLDAGSVAVSLRPSDIGRPEREYRWVGEPHGRQ